MTLLALPLLDVRLTFLEVNCNEYRNPAVLAAVRPTRNLRDLSDSAIKVLERLPYLNTLIGTDVVAAHRAQYRPWDVEEKASLKRQAKRSYREITHGASL